MRIFISAVTNEFGKARDAVASDLRARGHEVKVQSDFTQGGDAEFLLERLHDYIRDCNAVVCVIGKRSGSCPPYRTQGRDTEAEPLYRRDLAISEKALGPNHPEVAIVLNTSPCSFST